MKEQILALEATDDLHTMRDKIARAQAGRLVLMWRALKQPLRRRLDLVLMKCWASMAGSELAIVSADEKVRRLAQRTGIPCHPNLTASALSGLSPRSAPGPSIHSNRRTRRPPAALPRNRRFTPLPPALRVGIFSAALLAIASVFLLLLPSATIYAVFPSRTLEIAGILDPASCTELSTRLTVSERRSTSGRILAPTAFAIGKVTLTNISNRVLNLSAGLQIASENGVSYETMEGFLLSPVESRTAAVRALEPGPASNLAAGKASRVLGPLSLSLKARNPDPLSGGSEAWRSAVSNADWQALQKSAAEEIQDQASTSLAALAGTSRMIVEESLRVELDPLDQPDLAVNTPADTLGLSLHAAASLLACPADRVRLVAAEYLRLSLRSGESLAAEDMLIRLVQNKDGRIEWTALAAAIIIPDRAEMALALRLQSPAGAVSILRGRFGALGIPEMERTPDWLPLLPLFPFQIIVRAAV
jgi:hypothetical protein